MTTIEDLDRRVTTLERAQNDTTETLRWVVAKLGRVSAVQDEHTLRLERIETTLADHTRTLSALPRAIAEQIAEQIQVGEKRLLAAVAEQTQASEKRLLAAIGKS
jgi:uncharacterized coiled-coil protein SlyX